MAYNILTADRVREYLFEATAYDIEEKEMFGGIVFLVNGKMCVNVSGENLMCRFDPARTEELAARTGYVPLIMKNRELKGYCDVTPEGFKTLTDFKFWLQVCLEFNERAKRSKR